MADDLVCGGRVILVERPTGYDSKDYPLEAGAIYHVADFEGSNVHLTVASARADTTYPVNRGRLRALSSWERTEGGHWVCECDGVRFRFTRVGRGWSGKAYYDGDECMTTCTDRDKGLVELYAMVRHNRAEAEARRRFPGN